jgi:general secretion pathway protein D
MNKKRILLLIFLFIPLASLSCWKRRSIIPKTLGSPTSLSQKKASRQKHTSRFLAEHDSPPPQLRSQPKKKTSKHKDESTPSAKKNDPTQEKAVVFPEGKLAKNTANKEKAHLEFTEQKHKTSKDIYLNFENTSLTNFINYIADRKKMNLIPNKGTDAAKVSLTIRKPLSLDGAWNVFITILDMAGFALVTAGNDMYKVLPKNQKLNEVLPIYIGTAAKDLPNSDETIRYICYLTNISTSDVQQLLASMLSSPHKLVTQPHVNGFIITDKAYNIKAAMDVILELDQTDAKQAVTVLRLKRANARDVKDLFNKLIERNQGNPISRLLGRQQDSTVQYFPSTIKIVAEERTNSLILMGDQKSIKKIEDFIVENVDKELKGVESPFHIYDLKYADAEHIQGVLDSLVNNQGDSTAAQTGGVRGGVKYFQKMKFQVDKENNRLIVSCVDKQDWKLIKKTIEDLDKPQPQVAIETLLVSVDFTDIKEIGGQIRSKNSSMPGRNIEFQAATSGPLYMKNSGTSSPSLLGNLLNAVTAGQGTTLLTFGKAGDIWSFFKLLKQQTNATILSKPFIIATNMQQAQLTVGETQYVIKEQVLSGSQEGDKSYEAADANLTLQVTPQINLDGMINLQVHVEQKEFVDSGQVSLPDTATKTIDTNVSVANGQILVLGGFVKTKASDETYKSPLLSKIPILGWLAKNKKRTVRKEYIFFFMSPTIIKPRTSPGLNLYTKMKLHQSENDITNAVDVKQGKDIVHNWFFNYKGEDYSHKVVDFANARYQPTTVDIKDDPYYNTTSSLNVKQKKQPPGQSPLPGYEKIKQDYNKLVHLEEPEENVFPQNHLRKEFVQAFSPPKEKYKEEKAPSENSFANISSQARTRFKNFAQESAPPLSSNIAISGKKRQLFEEAMGENKRAPKQITDVSIQTGKRQQFKDAFTPTKREIFKQTFAPIQQPVAHNAKERAHK